MITVIRPYQNKSNRLIQNLHFEVFCMEHGIDYSNPTLHELAKLYPDPADTASGRIPEWQELDSVITFQRENRHSPDALLALSRGHCGVAGWGFRVPELVSKWRHELRRRYCVKEFLYHDFLLFNQMQSARAAGVMVVGIHIRRSDYRVWSNGDFFYGDDVYQRIIDQIRSQVNNGFGQECLFVIFHDEPLERDFGDDAQLSSHDWFVDHALMGHCDLLVGPPSTFSLWAAFIGGTKLLHVMTPYQEIRLSDFHEQLKI